MLKRKGGVVVRGGAVQVAVGRALNETVHAGKRKREKRAKEIRDDIDGQSWRKNEPDSVEV
jgi:hypothetical protein